MSSPQVKWFGRGHAQAMLAVRRCGPMITLRVRIRREPKMYSAVEFDPAQARNAIYALQKALEQWDGIATQHAAPDAGAD